ncbi:MAG: glycoside hydrolase family 2 [bacterium]|nr:glycoside hydrolase family 2 [bacterium]
MHVCGFAVFVLSAVVIVPSLAHAGERDGLLLEYTFERDARDTSGNDHHGAVNGSPKFAEGREGLCMEFGGGDWIDSGMMLPEMDTFTVECWVNPGDTQAVWADVLGNHAGGGINGMVFQQNGEDTNRFVLVYGSTSGRYIESKPVTLIPGKWQHVACVKDTQEMRLHLNGVLIDVVAADGPMAASTVPFRVGLGFPGAERCFNGMIDEVRVWDRALDSFDVSVSEAEQLDQFAVAAGTCDYVTVHWVHGKGIVAPGEPAEVELSLDGRLLPAAVTAIDLSFEVSDYAGNELPPLPPVVLRKDAEFSGKVPLPSKRGYYHVTYKPFAVAADRKVPLGAGGFSFAVLSDAPSVDPSGHDMVAAPTGNMTPAVVVSLDGDRWLIATDPDNVGRGRNWQTAPVAEAKPTKAPWIIQDAFPGYHGVAWYWREFEAPANPHPQGRYILHFSQIDYLAEVWLNGAAVGGHEGGETPFALDVTDAVRAGAPNILAVRVLNPTHERIDGIVLNETPHRCKVMPYHAGAAYNHGGITGSVELRAVPVVHIEDLYVRADAETGDLRIQATVRNAANEPLRGRLDFMVAPAATGESFEAWTIGREFPPGDSTVETAIRVDEPHVWDLNDPYLYRVTARAQAGESGSVDERSVRCGFRVFRFEDGYFRLNGRRIFLRSSHTVNHYPIGLQFPHDPDLARRDLLNAKVMGFNMVRFICGGATQEQLDLCDEIGLLVYDESYASWYEMVDTPQMTERFDRSLAGVMRRDRNHPCVVIWGLLNEITDGPLFRHAVDSLPLVRFLDDSRMVMLNSGRWDGDPSIGSICNPGSTVWEPSLGIEAPGAKRVTWNTRGGMRGYFDRAGDAHTYMVVPQTAESTALLRSVGHDTQHVFLSEYGIGSAVDLWRTVRHFEQLGKAHLEDAQFYKDNLDRFLADWQRWDMGACFDRPQDFFATSLARMASHRTLGLNAIRANPNLVGHNVTGMIDHVMSGEGLTTAFREMKSGAIDALYECWAPLRLCLFAEPVSMYRGATVKLEAMLANEDALRPGTYPIRLEVIASDGSRALERTVAMTIPDASSTTEPPFVLPVFSEEITIDGPPGKYRFVASFEKGAAATGGKTEFYVTDAAEMPSVDSDVVLWGQDPGLAQWLEDHGIRARLSSTEGDPVGEVILVGEGTPAGDRAAAFADLSRRVEEGATAIFLSPGVFAEGDNPVAWLPSAAKGSLVSLNSWLYLMDAWGKNHPVFEGLPSNGLLDYVYYREIIRDTAFVFDEPPAEAAAGGIEAAVNYSSGLLVSVHDSGAGRLVLNTLLIRENLGTHPAAERLLRNMLRYAAGSEGAV